MQKRILSKIYNKRDNFNFEIVNFPFLDGNVPCSPFYFAIYSFCESKSNVDDFKKRNTFLTSKLLKQD